MFSCERFRPLLPEHAFEGQFDTLAKVSPLDAWEAVPEFGRHQMGAVIFLEGRAPLHQVQQHVRPIELRGQDPGEGSGGTD